MGIFYTLTMYDLSTIKNPLILLFLPLLFLVGCGTHYPLDIPEGEWMEMSSRERQRAREKEAELEKAREKRRAAEAEARAAESLKWLKRREATREKARYGDRVQCVLSGAKAYVWGEWRSIEPVALDIVRGMVLDFDIQEAEEGDFGFQEKGFAGFDGQTLSLCPEKDMVQRNSPSCARLLGTFEEYARGIKKRIGVDEFIKGKIRCDLAPGKGMPERLIIER